MALSLPAAGALRISQVLPMLKCSRCGEETDINFADQHVCKEKERPVSRSTDRASTVSGISVPSLSSYSSHSRSSTSTKRAPSVRTIQRQSLDAAARALPRSPSPDSPGSPVSLRAASPAPTVRSAHSHSGPRSPSPAPSQAPSRMTPSPVPSRTPELPPTAPLVLRKLSRASDASLPPQPPPPTHAPPPPDTSIGGEAGMAGVGRRGFAAAAQAALFTGHLRFGLPSPGLSPTSIYGHAHLGTSPTSPIDGRLSSLSAYLNISTDLGGTPPLSPSHSPASQSSDRLHSPDDAPSPGAQIARANSRSPSPVDVIDGSGSRSLAKGKGKAVGGLSSLANKLRDTSDDQPTPTSPDPLHRTDRTRSRAPSNARSEAESETMLAYGSWRSESPTELPNQPDENTIAFPRRPSNASDHPPKRSDSQSSGYSSSSSGSGSARRVKQSAGAQTLSALREEDEDDVTPISASAVSTVPVTAIALDALVSDADRLNLPARSKTSASVSSASSSVRRKRIRTCAKCEKRIDDGRWIKVDDGDGGNTVLCEQDWKMLYLPKCRQCGLAIETQAIYASDGQLKGKYHKGCFNCYSCHQPFPDRSFYVYQERPYCKYHYHEANNSLCAAPSCREPIEGPCAVSYSGARYHPEHFTCEYEDVEGRCKMLLKEYWEVNGERMCERHAIRTAARSEDDGDRVKAKKRQTRFLDLAPANGSGGRDLC